MSTGQGNGNGRTPNRVMGCSRHNWKVDELRHFLRLYHQPFKPKASKTELLDLVDRLSRDQNLNRIHRQRFLRARRTSAALPRTREEIEDVVDPRQATRPTQIQCAICMDEGGVERFPRRRISALCKHEPNACLSCLSRSISTQFEVKMWDQISCPCCGELLAFDDIKLFGDVASAER